MKKFFRKIRDKVLNMSQEGKVGLTIALVTILFFGGIGVTKSWWLSSPSSKISSKTEISSSSKEEKVASELDDICSVPYPMNAKIVTYYYDNKASDDIKEKSLIYYENKYIKSNGLNVTLNNENFEVKCCFNGIVKQKINDPIYGLNVIIESPNNVLVSYSSLSSSNLKVGEKVLNGSIIGYAGSCEYGSFLNSNHLHLEISKNNNNINPLEVFNKPLGEI